jgi:hypothetical protein
VCDLDVGGRRRAPAVSNQDFQALNMPAARNPAEAVQQQKINAVQTSKNDDA